jgi:hypothetical protein
MSCANGLWGATSRGGENGHGGSGFLRANLYRSPRPHGASRSPGARNATLRCHWTATDGIDVCTEHRLWPTSPSVYCLPHGSGQWSKSDDNLGRSQHRSRAVRSRHGVLRSLHLLARLCDISTQRAEVGRAGCRPPCYYAAPIVRIGLTSCKIQFYKTI